MNKLQDIQYIKSQKYYNEQKYITTISKLYITQLQNLNQYQTFVVGSFKKKIVYLKKENEYQKYFPFTLRSLNTKKNP